MTKNITIAVTNDGGLADPPPLIYSVTPAPLNDGDVVNLLPDSGPLGNDGLKVGTPIFKTNVVNGYPVVRFSGDACFNLKNIIPCVAPYCCFAVLKPATPTSNLAALGGGAGGNPCCHLNAGGAYYSVDQSGYITGPWSWTGFHVFFIRNFGPSGFYFYVDGGDSSNQVGYGGGAASNISDFTSLGLPQGNDGDWVETIFYNTDVGLSVPDRSNICKTLGMKYGIPVTTGVVIDPLSVAGVAGWWKADSLL